MAKPAFILHLLHEDPAPFIHRFRNLAEDLYRQIELAGHGTVADIDAAIDELRVVVHKKAQRKAVARIIEHQLNEHFFSMMWKCTPNLKA